MDLLFLFIFFFFSGMQKLEAFSYALFFSFSRFKMKYTYVDSQG